VTDPDLSHLPKEARDFQGQPAGLMSRLLANIVDALVVVVVLVATYLGINGLLFFLDPRSFHFREPIPLATVSSALVVSGVYLGAGWAIFERTYGAHVMGLRVVGRGGRRIRVLVAGARAAACVLFPIGLLWCAVNPFRHSVQDIVLRTSVIYDWRPRTPDRH
jgi:uncharacterized RDD family membrane protein YckC